MKVKEVISVRTYYVTMETVNGDFHYRTDWTGNWEFLNGSSWQTIDDTEELQKTLTEYWSDETPDSKWDDPIPDGVDPWNLRGRS